MAEGDGAYLVGCGAEVWGGWRGHNCDSISNSLSRDKEVCAHRLLHCSSLSCAMLRCAFFACQRFGLHCNLLMRVTEECLSA